ncbi:hypothetical protein AURDEDRAFT_131673 [Auricularia subglabra TFB-10046 SS5]|uniref:WD40 repeat-like protein n=1 Tax=Auricularia subglabra (strain TFB-10046 / SS5) TaxID=717982 RepID=J0D443_AURST|nr:hypothetical protein AURDEDRAFT_131673 [Auricularia subglabra TFB-10046 SS5]
MPVYQENGSFWALHTTPVLALVFSPCSNFLVSIGAGPNTSPMGCGSYLVVWHLDATFEESASRNYFYAIRTEFTLSQALWPSAAAGLLVSGNDGSLTMIKQDAAANRVEVLSFRGHRSSICALAHSPNRALVVSASNEDMAIWAEAEGPSLPKSLVKRLPHRCSSGGAPTLTVIGLTWIDDSSFLIAYEKHPYV